jgi:DNA-binding transcriptional ArsR family regulator
MPNQSTELDALFQSLADPTRRAILARLAHGPARVTDLAQPFDMALPTFLQHLRRLEDGGLIATEKTGRVRTCRLRTGALAPARDWMAEQRLLWEGRLDRLEDYLATLTEGPKP